MAFAQTNVQGDRGGRPKRKPPRSEELGSEESGSEERRLEALYQYNILDTRPERAFDRIVRLTAGIFDMPIVLISLVDEDRLWFKARYGTEIRELKKQDAFCPCAIQSEDVTVIPDATKDERFAKSPYVTENGIRFYAGAPLITSEGYRIGTLCMLDTSSRGEFGTREERKLKDLASIVIDELELRREAEVRAKREQELEEARGALEEANDRMVRFFGRIAHDLQTPLTGALMAVDMLEKTLDCAEESTLRYLDRIRRAGKQVREMAESLMDLSKIQREEFDLETCLTDVRPLLADVCDAARGRVEDQTRRIELEIEDSPLRAEISGSALRRVFNNLLENGLQHTKGDITVHGYYSAGAEKKVIVEISDVGPGMDSEEVEHLFEPFHCGENGGTGLGLAVANDLVETIGGTIEVDTEIGEGTSFRVLLPYTETA